MIIFRFSILFSIISLFSVAQKLDTSLVFMRTTPYTLNILQQDGKVFIGTSDGAYQIDGLEFIKVDDRQGYVTYNDDLEVMSQVAFSTLVHFKGSSFLPEKFHGANVQMVRNQSLLYVVASGSLFIYELRPYELIFPGYSVRSISDNLVATYKGIFMGDELFTAVSYSSGKIYEFNDTIVLCYDGLYVQLPDTSFHRVSPLEAQFESKGVIYGHAREYIQVSQDTRFLFTTTGVFKLDSLFQVSDIIFEEAVGLRSLHERWLEPHYLGDESGLLVFSYANKVYRYNYLEESYTDSLSLPGNIYSGVMRPNSFDCFVSSTSGTFIVSEFKTFHKISEKTSYHTLLLGRKGFGWLYCSSNYGLDAYDIRGGRMHELIDGVEFNQYALHVRNDTLFAGSVGGLYLVPTAQVEQLIALNLEKKIAKVKEKDGLNSPEAYIIAGMAGVLIFLLYLNFIRKSDPNPLNSPSNFPIPDLKTRVMDYINQNLATASIENICSHFQFSSTKLYQLTQPEKPGELIRRLRTEQVRKMRNAGYSKTEIAEATGFSKSYVGRVK